MPALPALADALSWAAFSAPGKVFILQAESPKTRMPWVSCS